RSIVCETQTQPFGSDCRNVIFMGSVSEGVFSGAGAVVAGALLAPGRLALRREVCADAGGGSAGIQKHTTKIRRNIRGIAYFKGRRPQAKRKTCGPIQV